MDKALLFGTAFGLAALLSGLAAPVQALDDMEVDMPSYSASCQAAYTKVQDRFEAGEFQTLAEAGDALATVPADCHLARREAAVYRPAMTYRASELAGFGLTFCGQKTGYQINTYDYSSGEQTLMQPSPSTDPRLPAITQTLNGLYASKAAAALAEGKSSQPVGLQNLEVTLVVEDGALLLRYAVPAAGFDHSLAATRDLVAAGPLRLVSDSGAFQLVSPPDAAITMFPMLSSLATELNLAFDALATEAGFTPGSIQAEFSPAGLTLAAA